MVDGNINFLEHLANFLIGEGRLENHLEEWPPIEANVNKAKFELIEAKRYLQLATSVKVRKYIFT